MKLQQNVPNGERVVRIVAGLAAAVGGVVWAVNGGLVAGWVVAASGLGFAASGAIGWCPACALVGRKLPQTDRKITYGKLKGVNS